MVKFNLKSIIIKLNIESIIDKFNSKSINRHCDAIMNAQNELKSEYNLKGRINLKSKEKFMAALRDANKVFNSEHIVKKQNIPMIKPLKSIMLGRINLKSKEKFMAALRDANNVVKSEYRIKKQNPKKESKFRCLECNFINDYQEDISNKVVNCLLCGYKKENINFRNVRSVETYKLKNCICSREKIDTPCTRYILKIEQLTPFTYKKIIFKTSKGLYNHINKSNLLKSINWKINHVFSHVRWRKLYCKSTYKFIR